MNRRLNKCEKLLKTNDKDNLIKYDLLCILKKNLEEGKLINVNDFTKEENKLIKQFQLLSSKPIFFIANISDYQKCSSELNQLKQIAAELGSFVIPASIKIEQEISLLEDDEKKEYLELMDMDLSLIHI